MSTTTIKNDINEALIGLLDQRINRSSGKENEIRSNARSLFAKTGLPTKKEEEYKFTGVETFVGKHLKSIDEEQGMLPSVEEVQAHFINEPGHHLAFLNGSFKKEYSKIEDDSNISIDEASDIEKINTVSSIEEDVFVALNTGLVDSYLNAHIKGESKAVFVYHIIDNRNNEVVANPRITITTETSTSSNWMEKTITLGDKAGLINKVIEADVQPNASLNISVVQSHESNVIEIHGIKAQQHKDSRFYANTFSFRGGMIRNNLNVSQEDQNCETHMHGLYLLDGKSHVDNHTSVDHKKPNSYSNELYKGIVDGSAQAVFNGKIYVRQDAQQTNAFQSNNNISLSDSAIIHTKPQLEIWADDVKCSHGCTIGQLDEDAVYYLRARGIGKRAATAMLLIAFAEEAFEYVPFDFLKEELHQTINQRLAI